MDWKAGFDSAFSDVFRGRNLLLLIASWLGGILVFMAYGTLSGQSRRCRLPVACPVVALEKNETGPVSARSQDAEIGSQLRYSITFDNLSAQDSALGVLKTASSKSVRIDNLHVAFQQPETMCPGDPGQDVRWRRFYDLLVPRPRGSGVGQLGILAEFGSAAADWSAGIDLGNATDVEIRNLTWRIDEGRQAALEVACKIARLRGDSSCITLRGHAVIVAGGMTLESNCVEMNVCDELFVVRGRYLLTGDGRRKAGFGACFDRDLRVVNPPISDAGEGERWANGLPRGAF